MPTRAVRSLVVAVLTGALLAGCAGSDWRQVGRDGGHTGFNRDESTLTIANVGTLSEAWSTELYATASEPIVHDGQVQLITAGASSSTGVQVAAWSFRVGDGTAAWDTPLVDDPTCPATTVYLSEMIAVEDVLYSGFLVLGPAPPPADACGDYSNPLWLDPEDGSVLRDSLDYIYSSPPVHDPDGNVFVQVLASTSTVRVYAEGAMPWVGEVPGAFFGLPVMVAPSARAGMVHVAAGSSVHSYSMDGCGQPVCAPTWSRDLVTQVTSVVDDGSGGLLVAAGSDLFRLDRSNGDVATTVPLAGPIAGIAVSDDNVFVAAGNLLYAFSPQPGPPIWTAGLPSNASAGPVVAGDVVYVGKDGAVDMFTADGCGSSPTCDSIGHVDVPGAVDEVTVADGRLFVVSRASTSASRLTVFAPST